MKTVTAKLHDETYEELIEDCDHRGITVSECIRNLVGNNLDNQTTITPEKVIPIIVDLIANDCQACLTLLRQELGKHNFSLVDNDKERQQRWLKQNPNIFDNIRKWEKEDQAT